MSLLQVPISHEATAAVATISDQLARGNSRMRLLLNQVVALSAIVADLLKSMAYSPARPCARSLNANGFIGARIGYRPFKRVLSALTDARMVAVTKGFIDRTTGEGRVTRILPAGGLLDCLAAHGINPANREDHIGRAADEPLVASPIQRRAASTRDAKYRKIQGRRLPVDMTDLTAADIAARVTSINEYLGQQGYEGMTFDGLFRGFNNGDDPAFNYDEGGRLYAVGGGYQSMEKVKRKLIRINGELTTEVDIGASHLTILHSLMGVELPNPADPYDIPGIRRDAVKRFVTASLGSGKVLERWSKESADDYAEDFYDGPMQGYSGDIRKDYPIEHVRNNVLHSIPVLAQWTKCGYKWDDLQFEKSEIIFSSV